MLVTFWKQDDHHLSDLLPFQKNSTLPSKVLCWLQTFELISNPLPVVLMQECLAVYIKKQVNDLNSLANFSFLYVSVMFI